MKIIVVHIFLSILGFVFCLDNEESIRKCHAFSGEDANTNLENAVEVYKNCFNSSFVNFKHLVATQTCMDITPIKECNNNIVKKIEECKSVDESYFPKHIFHMITDYANHICSKTAPYKFSILLEHQICYPSLSKGINCFQKFRFFNVSAVLTREEMCNDHIEVNDCFGEYINSTCATDSFFRKLVNGTFDIEESPCKGSSHRLTFNTILTVFAICIALMKTL